MEKFNQSMKEWKRYGTYKIGEVLFQSIKAYKNENPTPTENLPHINSVEGTELVDMEVLNYSAEPEEGNFPEIRIYPCEKLFEYYLNKSL